MTTYENRIVRIVILILAIIVLVLLYTSIDSASTLASVKYKKAEKELRAIRDREHALQAQGFRLHMALMLLDCPKQKIQIVIKSITDSVQSASNKYPIDPILVAVLMKTESEFLPTARSSKGYKGILQTPWASMEFYNVDTLYGVMILEQKLVVSRGKLRTALALYKGGRSRQAYKQADEVLRLLKKVRTQVP